MLPQDRDEHEDGGDEDDGQGHLRDGPAGERLHLALGALAVFLLVPAREGGEEEEADEGEDDGDDAVRRGGGLISMLLSLDQLLGGGGVGVRPNSHQVREHHHILKLARQPDQVQGILVDRDLLREGGRVVGAQPRAAIGVDADAKVADAGLQVGGAGKVLDLRVGGVVDLCGVGVWCVVVVVEGEEEDVGY